ncbi:response regulator transcription factor [Paraburkholderia sp. BCC1885]|uniref:response regulator transcription factor n=1 Tax=Paraburkholderia sp. BCC1885 TaxID=2562669 RepID=UPI001183A629|nr:response regulator transcription factor [Paraburkholderia sp. BCC1885]
MKRIVIVDDHPLIRAVVSQLLCTDPELEIIGEAEDGSEGLELILSTAPDLVIIDLELPKIDGLTVIRHVRKVNQKIRIFVLSAKPEHLMAPHARLAGANGYFGKVRNVNELLPAVKSLLYGYDCFAANVTEQGEESGLNSLSSRELEVLHHIVRGINNKEIAALLKLSPKTVSTYKTRVQTKLGVSSVAGLIEFTMNQRLAG